MLTLAISIIASCGGYALSRYAIGTSPGWSATWAAAAFVVSQFVIARAVRKRMTADMQSVQAILVEGQKKIQAKTQRWQIRPPGSIAAAQKELESDMRVFVNEALAQTKKMRKYRLWVWMVDRQIATAQLQLNWMIKEFGRVDELMPKALIIDPTLVAMKMARLYMKGAPAEEIETVYRKGSRRVGFNRNTLAAATMAWIDLKRGREDEAFAVLVDAAKKSDDATLKANLAHLENKRATHFSNSGLGDAWYALHLEEPRIKTQRQHRQYR